MRFAIAPDSFKESLSAPDAAEAIARGVRRGCPGAEAECVPVADGGEGTVDALVAAADGEVVEKTVTGPLGEPAAARYGLLDGGRTAVIEMASASGLALVPRERRDPSVTTTRGTGELMVDALDRGVTRIVVGLGGSATNDGGGGMAQALGYRLLDRANRDLPPGGAAFRSLCAIDGSGRHPALDACEVLVACDVENMLCGPLGASAVYGPQKGASPEMAGRLDEALLQFGRVVQDETSIPVLGTPGAGAAGGLGAGLMAFARATLRPGFELVAEACNLRERLASATLAITGEGRLDGQTAHGKAPLGVMRMARDLGVPVVAFAGELGDGWEALHDEGLCAAFALQPGPMAREESMEMAEFLLERLAYGVSRLWRTAEGQHDS